MLGGKGWHITNQLSDKAAKISGKKNIRSYDNRYHISEKLNTSVSHRYSQEAVDLLTAVRDNKPFYVFED